MSDSQFQKQNQGFICQHCGVSVPPHQTSSRDHCPLCLWSLHVDVFPGDRENICKGLLEPIGVKIQGDKQQIAYRCQRCREQVFNVVAPDDNSELITELSGKPYPVRREDETQ